MPKQQVLFLCTGNSARSQMAEALLRLYAGDKFDVHSAGLMPKGINPYTVRVMAEIGIDIRSQHSKSIQEYMARMFLHYIITVCGHADQSCPQTLWAIGGVKLHWPFDDPAAVTGTDDEILAAFRLVRDQIDEKIREWIKTLNVQRVEAL